MPGLTAPPIHIERLWKLKCHLFGVYAALHVYTVRHRPYLDLSPDSLPWVDPLVQ